LLLSWDVFGAAPRDFRQICVAGIDDALVSLGKSLAESQVVLVNKEPAGTGDYAASERCCSS